MKYIYDLEEDAKLKITDSNKLSLNHKGKLEFKLNYPQSWSLVLTQAGETLDFVTEDFRNRIFVNKGTISEKSLLAVNTFVKGCKSDKIWDLLLDVGVFAGDNLSAALVKLKTSSTQSILTNVNFLEGDYSESTGLKGDGSSKYLRTGFRLIAHGENSASISNGLCVFIKDFENKSTQIAADKYILAQGFAFQGNTTFYSQLGVGHQNFLDPSKTGFYSFSQINESDIKFYRNAAVLHSAFNHNPVTDNSEITVLGRPTANQYTSDTISFYAIKKGLTDSQELALYNRVKTLQQSLTLPISS